MQGRSRRLAISRPAGGERPVLGVGVSGTRRGAGDSHSSMPRIRARAPSTPTPCSWKTPGRKSVQQVDPRSVMQVQGERKPPPQQLRVPKPPPPSLSMRILGLGSEDNSYRRRVGNLLMNSWPGEWLYLHYYRL